MPPPLAVVDCNEMAKSRVSETIAGVKSCILFLRYLTNVRCNVSLQKAEHTGGPKRLSIPEEICSNCLECLCHSSSYTLPGIEHLSVECYLCVSAL